MGTTADEVRNSNAFSSYCNNSADYKESVRESVTACESRAVRDNSNDENIK